MSIQPAVINLPARVIIAGDGSGLAQEILYVEGQFVIHADLRGAQWGFNVTAPCGHTLGRYRLKSHARAAARAMVPLVADWNGADLNSLFGSEQKARDAYNAALHFIKA